MQSKALNPYIRNIAVVLSYDGSGYHGWQIQKNALSVQEIFQKSLEKILNEKVDIKGCSRTDTGVHANMYVVNFKTSHKIECERLVCALNHFLPGNIAVKRAVVVPYDFHARYFCTGKEYIYKIWNRKEKNPFLFGRALHYWYPLNIQELDSAAQYFVGGHDFTAFATLDKREPKNMIRNIESFRVYKNTDMVELKVRANGFLYNMVRIMVGTLLKVAQGKISREDIPQIIESRNRSNAGPTAPPQGLYLNQVFYKEFDLAGE